MHPRIVAQIKEAGKITVTIFNILPVVITVISIINLMTTIRPLNRLITNHPLRQMNITSLDIQLIALLKRKPLAHPTTANLNHCLGEMAMLVVEDTKYTQQYFDISFYSMLYY